jgi:hypothetical protein
VTPFSKGTDDIISLRAFINRFAEAPLNEVQVRPRQHFMQVRNTRPEESLTADQLEARLRAALGLAGPPGQSGARSDGFADLVTGLRIQLRRLRSHAEAVGRVPEGYPLHVTFVIRSIAALLPWYTRPLRNFSLTAVDACDSMAAILEHIAADHVDAAGVRNESAARSPAAG